MSEELKTETAKVIDTAVVKASDTSLTKEQKLEVIKKAMAESKELQEDAPKDPVKVQTLQQMAVEKGVKLPKELSPRELHSQLLLDHHFGVRAVVPAFKGLSQHGKDRVFTALMQLPQDGLESGLNGEKEKLIYMAGQKALMAKHAIIFNRAKRERDAEMAAMAEKAKKKAEAEAAKEQSGQESGQSVQNNVETQPEVSDTQPVATTQTQES
jgi:hypothetical protein